ncbi:MAG TPA: PQQ-binding-like beta-propeller repeat protein [Acidimicrobiales bacterium]|nr:PQQ-binding-like beta-propeller repeat protein [Acidimicrobiales bacterium]
MGDQGPRRLPVRHPARLGLAVAVLVAVVSGVGACADDDDTDGSGLSGAEAGGTGNEAEAGAGDARPDAGDDAAWVRFGHDLANTRAVADETTLDTATVTDLAPAWEVDGILGVSGTPAVADGVVYLGDWTGLLRALDAESGDEVWNHDLGGGYVGGSVAVDDTQVVVGTFDARIVSLDRASGEPRWEASVDAHPKAVVFGSPVIVDGLVVVGVGSFEVFAPGDPPTFRGSVVALDAETGDERWRFWLTKGDATEGPGVSIWSSPAVDTERGVLYIGTGQAYALPAPPRSDALLALDLHTGAEVWTTQFTAGDAWTITDPSGLDADVGAAPNLFEAGGTDAVGVGDKAGAYRALDRDTGEVLWERKLTEGGAQGGIMASAAVADGTVYVASNDGGRDAVLVALDAAAGQEVWRGDVGAHVTGPLTWANGVLYVSDDSGRIAAYDADGGARLWAHDVPFPAAGGIAVVDGTVYAGWGWWLAGAPDDADGGIIAFRPATGEVGSGEEAFGDESAGEDGERGEDGMSGADVYQESCAVCHGGSGEGGTGPSLVGVDERLTRDEQIRIVRDGRGRMPAWDDELTAEEIEAVVDHQRTVLADAPDDRDDSADD